MRAKKASSNGSIEKTVKAMRRVTRRGFSAKENIGWCCRGCVAWRASRSCAGGGPINQHRYDRAFAIRIGESVGNFVCEPISHP